MSRAPDSGIPSILSVLVICTLALFLVFTGCTSPPTVQSINEMQKNPPENYITELEDIIRSDHDAAVREQAVFSLTAIAIDRNETNNVTRFLIETAEQEKDSLVKTAAFANYDLITRVNPQKPSATLNLTVSGRIRTGQVIMVNATVSTTRQPVKTVVGVRGLSSDVELLSPPVAYPMVSMDHPQEVSFRIRPSEPGDYTIPIILKMSYNQVEVDDVTQEVFLHVTGDGGTYRIAPES